MFSLFFTGVGFGLNVIGTICVCVFYEGCFLEASFLATVLGELRRPRLDLWFQLLLFI